MVYGTRYTISVYCNVCGIHAITNAVIHQISMSRGSELRAGHEPIQLRLNIIASRDHAEDAAISIICYVPAVVLMPPMQPKEDGSVRVSHTSLFLQGWGRTKTSVLVHVPLPDISLRLSQARSRPLSRLQCLG